MKKTKLWLLGILILATLLRLYHLTAISLWHDEAFSALLINYSWHEMLYRIGLDVHPPLYYDLLRLWAYIFGHSLWALRGFSAFFGIATVYMTYLFVKAAFQRENVALMAALFMAVSPFQIQYVTEARMYTLGTFLVMAAAYLLVRAFQEQKIYLDARNAGTPASPNKLWVFWALFAIATSGMMYTHYYLFFSVFAIALYALYFTIKTYRSAWRGYRYALIAYAAVLISYIPWLKTFLFQFHQVQVNYWIPKINVWSVPLTNWEIIFGGSADASKQSTDILLILGCILSLLIIYRIARKEQESSKWLILLGLIVPFIGSLLLSLKQSIFLDRYFLFAGLFYVVMIALFITEVRTKYLRYILLIAFVGISLFNYVKAWADMHIETKKGMSGAAQFINDNATSSNKIFVASSFEFFNFKYYNRTGIKPLLYTPGITRTNELPHFSGTALLNDDDLVQNFATAAPSGSTVWILWTTAYGGSKPNVPANWTQVDERGYEDVRPYGGTWIVDTEYRVN